MKTVIIGGGAAGASCAARLRRLDESAEIIMLEKTNEISIANCGLPYYVSDVISEREKMLAGELYDPNCEELQTARTRAHDLCTRYNALAESDKERAELLKELLPGLG